MLNTIGNKYRPESTYGQNRATTFPQSIKKAKINLPFVINGERVEGHQYQNKQQKVT